MQILFLDIETAPMTGYSWDIWKEQGSMDFITKDWYILCWCAKFLDGREVFNGSLHTSCFSEKKMLANLHNIMNKADVIVTQNGIRFDIPKINTRFIAYGMNPVKPFKNVDTLQVAKRVFAFSSNKLDYLGRFLGVGKKVKTGGFELWKKCIDGNIPAFKKMVKYCKNDVLLLERVYKKLLPFMNNHPNRNYYDGTSNVCPKCGSKSLRREGFDFLAAGKVRKYSCKKCGGWCRDGKVIKNG